MLFIWKPEVHASVDMHTHSLPYNTLSEKSFVVNIVGNLVCSRGATIVKRPMSRAFVAAESELGLVNFTVALALFCPLHRRWRSRGPRRARAPSSFASRSDGEVSRGRTARGSRHARARYVLECSPLCACAKKNYPAP